MKHNLQIVYIIYDSLSFSHTRLSLEFYIIIIIYFLYAYV